MRLPFDTGKLQTAPPGQAATTLLPPPPHRRASFPSSLPSLLKTHLKILKLKLSQTVLFHLNIISFYFFSSLSYFISSTYSPNAQLIQLTVCIPLQYQWYCFRPACRTLRDLRQRHLPVQPAAPIFVYLTFLICKRNLTQPRKKRLTIDESQILLRTSSPSPRYLFSNFHKSGTSVLSPVTASAPLKHFG
jgi:hypothetical protein